MANEAMGLGDLIDRVSKVLEHEPRLIQLPSEGKAVFVGDTHGDLTATEEVVRRHLKKPNRLVFLGDYVDRGDFSKQNIAYLLSLKLEHPDEIFLLAGNHEGFMVKELYPANFWKGLTRQDQKDFGNLFSKFPLAATSQNGILALHGGLPELPSLEAINQIEWGDDQWDRIVWGDFVEGEPEGRDIWGGRPQLSRSYFEKMMDQYQKKVLVRSHQPNIPLLLFGKRCITIFTSNAYLMVRTIAMVDLEKEVRDGGDVAIEKI